MRSPRNWIPVLCLCAVAFLALSPIRLDDFFLYLTFGRRLLTSGEFGPTDSLLFTIKNYQWELWHEWLSYVVYYSTYSVGGYKAVIVLRALLVAAAAALVWRACARGKLGPLTSVMVLSLAILAASPRSFRDRSSLFTDLFVALVLFALTDSRVAARGSKWKWLLPGLFLLWVQLHAGYLIAWFLVGLFVASHWRTWDFQSRREWATVSALCVLTTLCNPIFVEGVVWPIKLFLVSDMGILAQITEFTPTLRASFLSLPYKVFLLLYMVAVLSLSALTINRGGWFKFAAAITLTYLGLRYARMVALSGLGLGVLLAASLAQLDWLWLRTRSRWTGVLACAIPLVVISSTFMMDDRGLRFLVSGNSLHETVPEKAAQLLMELPPGNVFNEWELGGYLAWVFDGRSKIAAHGFVSDPDLVEQNIYRFSVSREGWNDIVLGGGVEYFILRRQSFEGDQDAAWVKELGGPDWRNIYMDSAAVIFQKVH